MKKITFCLLLFLALFQGHGQILIGNGTDLKNLPINPYYGYSYSQSIYTAAEINATGNITTISWYFGGPSGNSIPNSQNLKVYLGHTSKNNFSSSSDWESISNLTEVYTGGITVSGPGWASITLATPFNYNGADNLIVATAELKDGYDSSSDAFASHQVAGNRSLVYQNDGTPPNLTAPQDGSTDNYVPNIIFGGIAKACPTPFFLNNVMLTSTSAMIVWGNSAQGAGDSSQYYISQSNVAPVSSTVPSGNSTAFAMISDLQPNTVYYVWVRNVCNGTPAEWSYPVQFRTECNSTASLIENFDTTAEGTLPACWGSILRGNGISSATTIGTFVGNAQTGANSVRINNDSASNTADIIMVLPKLNNLASGTHRLKFYADGNAANGLIIGTLNNASNTATFTPFQSITTTTSYAEYTVDFSAYNGADTYVGIKLNSPGSYNPVFLDRIRWDMTPACADVSQITVPVIGAETATVNWTAGGSETEWNLVYSAVANNANPETLTPVTASTNPTKELTGLTPNTPYNLWVRSICGSNPGEWIGPFLFRTACVAIADFNENFDTTTVPALPSCWSSIIRGTVPGQYVNIQSYGFGSQSAPNSILMTPGSYITMGTENDVILISPSLNTLSTGTHRVKFFAKGTGNIQVGTLNNNTNTAVFTSFQDVTITNNMMEFVVDFSGYNGTDSYIGFRINASAAYTNTYLDNIRWEANPLCPDVSGITVQGVTPDTATLSWTEGGIETAWEIVYGAPTTTDPSILAPIVAANTNTKEITGLQDNTTYAAWVRSSCGVDKGAWIGPVQFKTECLAVTTITENFDAVTTPGLPSCWSSIIRGNTSTALVRSSTSNPHSQTKSIELYNQEPSPTVDVILVSPYIGNLGDGTHRLRFHATHYYPSQIQIGTLDSASPNATFTLVQTLTIGSPYTEYIVDFTQWAGITDQFIGIRLSATNVNSYAYIDDFIWEEAPTCPDVEMVDIIDITTSGAYTYWEMGEVDADAWQVSYAPANITDASAGTISSTLSVEEFIIDELTPDTEYNVWVRSVCGSLNGNWIGPKKFRTKCNAGNAINENFDASTALPTCWSKIIRGDSFAEFFASILNTTVGPHSGPNNISMFNSTNNSGNDIILVSPPMDNLAAGTHQLTFYLKGNTGGIQVGTLDDNTSENAVFTSLTTVAATTTYTKYTIDFSGYSGTDAYIGIRHGGVNNTTIYVDDIVWEPIPTETCTAVSSVNENFDTTAVDALPACWAAILRGPSENDIDAIGVKTDMNDLVSEPNAVNIFKGLSGADDDQILVLPQLSNLNAGTHKLAFYHAGPPVQIEVGTLNNNTDTAVFTLKETINVASTWAQTIIDFTNYSGTDTYIGLRLNTGAMPFAGIFIDNVVWSSDLGNGSFDNDKFTYYPNPVKNILHLSYAENMSDVSLYNVLGQQVLQKQLDANKAEIDMAGLPNGTYLVKVVSNDTSKTFKVVKQ